MKNDKSNLDELTQDFFGAFSSLANEPINLDIIYDLFIPEGLVIKNVGYTMEIYNLDQFVKPREELLNSGRLINFYEKEIAEKTEIFGNIAQRWSTYEKQGILDGHAFKTIGMKAIQFVNVSKIWKMSSVIWDDERDGLTIH